MKRQGTGSFNDGRTISAKGDASGVTGHVNSNVSGILRNPATINSAVEITSDENAVMAGPVTIGTNGSLTVSGTLVIV
tara:strand:+ start:771 stop:1004 length:234 start_codon:yes stop_codon:yes gene_type:complete